MSSQPSSLAEQDSRRDTDPYIRQLTICKKCHHTIDGLRVHEGSTSGNRQHRGRLCQTVRLIYYFFIIPRFLLYLVTQCPECHWTEYLTDAYEYTDAVALLVRIQARQDKAYIPKSAVDAPLRLATQPIERQDGKIDCANPQCYTKSNQTRTQGNRNCIEYLCGACCKSSRTTAAVSGVTRPKCTTHKIVAVNPAIPASHAPQATLHRVTQPAVDPVLLHPSQNPPVPQHRPIVPDVGRQRILAQPMGHNWERRRQEAIDADVAVRSAKLEKQELAETKKRTCDLRIWFKVCAFSNFLEQRLT
jgi:hypothetical protein